MTAQTYILTATILAWAALGLFVFALLGDSLVQRVKRLRGTARRRCPRCWYDLSHTPGGAGGSITCSECGRVVTRERQLYRGRKRWKLAVVAVLLLLGSYALRVTPGVRDRGWVAAVPTTVLILGLPWLEETNRSMMEWHRMPNVDLTLRQELLKEFIEHRLDPEQLYRWQGCLLGRVCVAGERRRADDHTSFFNEIASLGIHAGAFDHASIAYMSQLSIIRIETRPVWPEGVEPVARFDVRPWPQHHSMRVSFRPETDGLIGHLFHYFSWSRIGGHSSVWPADIVPLGTPAPGSAELAYEVVFDLMEVPRVSVQLGRNARIPFRRERLVIPFQTCGHVEEILAAVESSESAIAAFEDLAPMVSLGSHVAILFPTEPLHAVLRAIAPATLGARLELLADGAAVASSVVWWRASGDASRGFAPSGSWMLLEPDEGVDIAALREAAWNVRLTGDPLIALQDFEATHYWHGEIVLDARAPSPLGVGTAAPADSGSDPWHDPSIMDSPLLRRWP